MLYWLDIFGTFTFAVAGAFKASRHGLDILGVLVLATVTGVGGGIVRDVLLGATPPAAFQDETYLFTCLAGGLLTFCIAPHIAQRWRMVRLADALGLGVFTAIGAAKATQFGLGPLGVAMMGVMTAAGGGVIRDILVREIPAVLNIDFYATAALVGGVMFLACGVVGLNDSLTLVLTATVTTGLRLLAMKKNYSLPRIRVIE